MRLPIPPFPRIVVSKTGANVPMFNFLARLFFAKLHKIVRQPEQWPAQAVLLPRVLSMEGYAGKVLIQRLQNGRHRKKAAAFLK